MPSGKVHDSVAIISIVPVFLTGHYLFKLTPPELYAFCVATIFSQLMFGPDLDAPSCEYKRWGILRWIWIPYRKIFTHRSRFSHGILFGPIIRCVYLFIMAILVFASIRFLISQLIGVDIISSLMPKLSYIIANSSLIDFKPFLIPLILGIFVGAAIHTFTDKVFSFFKNLV